VAGVFIGLFLALPLLIFALSPSAAELTERGVSVGAASQAQFIPGRVVRFQQGLSSTGATISPDISDASVVVVEKPPSTAFCSLGLGGQVIVEFPDGFDDGPGADLAVTERTWGDGPDERAAVWVSEDGVNWQKAGVANNAASRPDSPDTVSQFDFATVKVRAPARFVKLVDVTASSGVPEQNGFDVASIRVLHPAAGETR